LAASAQSLQFRIVKYEEVVANLEVSLRNLFTFFDLKNVDQGPVA
jgi:hypothetical protein